MGRRRYGRPRYGRLFLLFLIFVLLIVLFNFQIKPVVESVTENASKIKSVNLINDVVLDELDQNSVDYGSLVTVSRNSEGDVLSITANMVSMNRFKSKVIRHIQKELGDGSGITVGVSIGTLMGGDIFHGRGPKIPLRLTLSGNVTADFKSTFQSAGINQTRHQIYLSVHASVYSFLPGFHTTTDVNTNVLIAETVIVGSVPEFFASVKQP